MNKYLILTIVALCLVAASAEAKPNDYGGIYPTKWSQPPVMDQEWAIIADSAWIPEHLQPRNVIASDWMCQNPAPVTDVHWWGGYDVVISDAIESFIIGIHEDIPAAGDIPSHPGPRLAQHVIPFLDCNETFFGNDINWNGVYSYTAILPEPFAQVPGTIYWLSIIAVTPGENAPRWGWHSSSVSTIDYAVQIHDYDPVSGGYNEWNIVGYEIEPNEMMWLDMAFELTYGQPIPEPQALLLAGCALAGLATIARRKIRQEADRKTGRMPAKRKM